MTEDNSGPSGYSFCLRLKNQILSLFVLLRECAPNCSFEIDLVYVSGRELSTKMKIVDPIKKDFSC